VEKDLSGVFVVTGSTARIFSIEYTLGNTLLAQMSNASKAFSGTASGNA